MSSNTHKILLVEDDPDLALYMRTLLESFGYSHVYTASTNEEAHRIIDQHHPQLVIADIFLANGMSGIDVANYAYAENHIPVIFTTASEDPEIFSKAKECNPFGFLIKPVKHRELEFAIELAFQHHQMERELLFSQSHLNQAQLLGNMGSWEWNIQTNELIWSDQIYRIFGLKPQQFEATYPTFLDRIHPDDRQAVIDAVNATLNDNENYDIEHRVVCPDGNVKIVHEVGDIFYDQHHRPLRMVGTVFDITARKETEKKIQHLAFHDPLTDLPNRLLLNDRLNVMLAQARRKQDKFAVLFIDLDGFKNVNDTYGHNIGDRVLKMVADRMKQSLRDSDTLARTGGDEFIILIDQLDSNEVLSHIANKLLKLIREAYELGGISIKLGASIGISIYPDNGMSKDDLLNLADDAMYKAKHKGKGKNCFVYAG